jgi:hypothetical protein
MLVSGLVGFWLGSVRVGWLGSVLGGGLVGSVGRVVAGVMVGRELVVSVLGGYSIRIGCVDACGVVRVGRGVVLVLCGGGSVCCSGRKGGGRWNCCRCWCASFALAARFAGGEVFPSAGEALDATRRE